MKILLINVSFGIGSTGKIVQSLFNEFNKLGHDTYAIYGRYTNTVDAKIIKSGIELESKFWHLLSIFSGNLYGGMSLSTIKIKKIIKKINPDVVHLHCINGYFVNIYSLIKFLKKRNIKTVLTNHAEFMFTANCGYALECNNWKNSQCRNCRRVKEFNGKFSLNRTHYFYKKMFNAFRGFERLSITNVSPWLTNRVMLSPIFNNYKERISTVLNPVSARQEYSKTNPYKKYKLNSDTKIILYVTADINNPEKGGQNIIKIAELCKNDNYHFFIKSPTKPSFALSDNISYIDDNKDNIFDLYHYADLSLVLSVRETFSMVVAESLCCGTPVVGFKAGGPESIAIKEYTDFIEYGDISSLYISMKNNLTKNIDKQQIIKISQEKYSQEKIAKDYLDIYESLIAF